MKNKRLMTVKLIISHPSFLILNWIHTQIWVHVQKGVLNLVIAFIIGQWTYKKAKDILDNWIHRLTYVTPFIQVDRLMLWVCPFESNDGVHYKQVSILIKKIARSAAIINHQLHSLCPMNSDKRLIVWFLRKIKCLESENKSSPPSSVKSWRGCQLRSII